MQKQTIIFTILFLSSILCYSQSIKGKWTSEFVLNYGLYPNAGNQGIEYGTDFNYHLLNRLGVSAQLHSFQSIFPVTENKHYTVNQTITIDEWNNAYKNYSMMLFNVNLFGDIFVTRRNDRLRLQAGATYFRGAYSAIEMAIFPDGISKDGYILSNNFTPVNSIGINVRLSYLLNLSSKCFMSFNVAAYTGGEVWLTRDPFLDILSAGLSVGYKF